MSPSSSCIVSSAPLSPPHLPHMHWSMPQSKEPPITRYLLYTYSEYSYFKVRFWVLLLRGIELARVSSTQTILTFRGYLIFLSYPCLMFCDFLLDSNCIECRGYTRAPRKYRARVNFLHVFVQTRWAFRCRCSKTVTLKSKRERVGNHGVGGGAVPAATRLPCVTCL